MAIFLIWLPFSRLGRRGWGMRAIYAKGLLILHTQDKKRTHRSTPVSLAQRHLIEPSGVLPNSLDLSPDRLLRLVHHLCGDFANAAIAGKLLGISLYFIANKTRHTLQLC